MRKYFFTIILFFIFTTKIAHAQAPIDFFTLSKIYTDDLYVLFDYLEFSVFDMSRTEVSVENNNISLLKTSPANMSVMPPLPADSPLIEEVKKSISLLPKSFYKTLKFYIGIEKIPVTLCSMNPPAFARPLKLYVKLKSVTIFEKRINAKGKSTRDVSLKIYGQIKDPTEDRVLVRFYDIQDEVWLESEGESLQQVMDRASGKLMADFGKFLKTKY